MPTPDEQLQATQVALRTLGDEILRPWLPFYSWLLPKFGLRLKPRYQAMLDEDRR